MTDAMVVIVGVGDDELLPFGMASGFGSHELASVTLLSPVLGLGT